MMNNSLFVRTSFIQKKIDDNKNLQTVFKILAPLAAGFILLICLFGPDKMKLAWAISVFLVTVLFGFDCYFVVKNKKLEMDIYHIQLEEQYGKERVDLIMENFLSDDANEITLMKPDPKKKFPILYYLAILAVEFLIGIIYFH